MALFSIEIADQDIARVITALAFNFNRPENIVNPDFDKNLPVSEDNPQHIPNPESPLIFANRMVREFLSDHVMVYETKKAKESAAASIRRVKGIKDPYK